MANKNIPTIQTIRGNVGIGTTNPRYQLDLAKPQDSTQVDYIALGVKNGPGDGLGNTLGSGLIWKANYTDYTKRSAGIVQIAEGHYFRSGLAFYTNNSANTTGDWGERMRIDMDGKVGIGTADPSANLEVSGASATLRVGPRYTSGGDRDFVDLIAHGSDTKILSNNERFHIENNSGDIIINPSGNVGIGTTSPGSKLEVTGDTASALLTLKSENGGANDAFMRFYDEAGGGSYSVGLDSSDSKFKIAYDADGDSLTTGTKLVMDTSGNVGIGTTGPGSKLHVVGETYFQLNTGSGESTTWKNATGNGLIQLGFQINGTDGMHHRSYIRSKIDTNGTYGGQLQFLVREHNTANQLEVMTLRSDGNVGIGTTSPSATLDVNASGGGVGGYTSFKTRYGTASVQSLSIGQVTAGNGAWIGMAQYRNAGFWQTEGTAAGVISLDAGGNISFATDSGLTPNTDYNISERMRITSAGNVGIGTTNPTAPLHVIGTVRMGNTSEGLTFSAGSGIGNIIGVDTGFAGYNAIALKASANTGIYLDTADNVGIGTTGPGQKLTVNGDVGITTSHQLFVNDIAAYTGAMIIGPTGGSELKFRTTGSERMRITSGGNVGIGTTSPDLKLDVSTGYNDGIRIAGSETNTWMNISIRSYVTEAQANAFTDHTHIFTTNPSGQTSTAFQRYGGTVIQCRNDGNTGFAIRMGDGTNWHVPFYINNNRAITCSSTVTATNFILSSDETLKENVKDLDVKVDAKWRSYKFKDSEETRYGVIAQELEETNPELVRTNDDGLKSVAYVDLLIAKIAELEARLEKAGL